jgi:hypothetical protein
MDSFKNEIRRGDLMELFYWELGVSLIVISTVTLSATMAFIYGYKAGKTQNEGLKGKTK